MNDDFLLVKAAADFLGVSPNTLRSWGEKGQITEYRHPVNNYRMFKKVDLKRMRKRIANPRKHNGQGKSSR